jgi:hypothetical protein
MQALRDADSEDQAVEALRREFDLAEPQARLVFDQQIRFLTHGRIEAMRRDLETALGQPNSEADP